MTTQTLCLKPIQIVVVSDAEKENCPPFPVAKVTVGNPQKRLQPERVFRDITDSVHRGAFVSPKTQKQRGIADTPLCCRV